MPSFVDFLLRRFRPAFDFGEGEGSLQRVLDAVNAAQRAGDERMLRAIWEHLDGMVARDEGRVLEANKPIYAGCMLGAYLNGKERFVEAEAILARVKMRKKGTLPELIHARFALADAIWGQGNRGRAESEALVWIEKLLEGRETTWPNSQFVAKLAQYRYDFETCATYNRLAFEDAPDAKHQPQIAANRGDARLRLLNALQWYDAGRLTPAIEQLMTVSQCGPSEEQRNMVLCQEFYWRSALGQIERVAELLEQARQLTQDSPLNANKRRLVRMLANYAQWQGDLAQCDALLDSLGAELDANDANQTLTTRIENLVLRGEWENARRIQQQKQKLHPVPSRHGSRYMALNAMGLAYLELRAQYCGAPSHLDNAEASLLRSAALIRGDRKLSLWMEALLTWLVAIQGGREEAAQRARAVAAQFDDWGDSPESQNALSSALMGTYLTLEDWKKAIQWGEKALGIGTKPAYLMLQAEILARAYAAQGNTARARQLHEMVVSSGFAITAVALARQQLKTS